MSWKVLFSLAEHFGVSSRSIRCMQPHSKGEQGCVRVGKWLLQCSNNACQHRNEEGKTRCIGTATRRWETAGGGTLGVTNSAQQIECHQ